MSVLKAVFPQTPILLEVFLQPQLSLSGGLQIGGLRQFHIGLIYFFLLEALSKFYTVFGFIPTFS